MVLPRVDDRLPTATMSGMDDARVVKLSKHLSRHLRHRPERLGLELEPGGWVAVDVLLAALAEHGVALTRAELEEVVARNDKRRFTLDAAHDRIRAAQGHSVPVDLALPDTAPPAVLFHGTGHGVLPSIRRDGLLPMGRHAVHLSADAATAARVGSRKGRPVVLEVDAAGMARAGHRFQLADNGVWLTAAVPARFLTVLPRIAERP